MKLLVQIPQVQVIRPSPSWPGPTNLALHPASPQKTPTAPASLSPRSLHHTHSPYLTALALSASSEALPSSLSLSLVFPGLK